MSSTCGCVIIYTVRALDVVSSSSFHGENSFLVSDISLCSPPILHYLRKEIRFRRDRITLFRWKRSLLGAKEGKMREDLTKPKDPFSVFPLARPSGPKVASLGLFRERQIRPGIREKIKNPRKNPRVCVCVYASRSRDSST